MTVTVKNTTATTFVSNDGGISFKPNATRTFDALSDILQYADVVAAFDAGTLVLDCAVGATVFILDERSDFGSVKQDEWRRRPIGAVSSVPSNTATLTEDSVLLPKGVWAFTVSAIGDGQLRIVDAGTGTALVTGGEGKGTMAVHGYISIPSATYIAVEAYHTSDDIDPPPSSGTDPDNTLYLYMAGKFACVDA